jgi:hypothetical protein
MTNEQCKALIMGMLEAFGTGQARAHKAQYVDEIMEKAGVSEAPGFIVSRDGHGEEQVQPIGDDIAQLQSVVHGMDRRFEAVEKQVESIERHFRNWVEVLERKTKDTP